MKQNHFISLVIWVMAGLIFSLGLCMCLLPQWNLFTTGVVLTIGGAVALISMGVVVGVKNAKNKAPINWKLVGKIIYGVVAALIMGLGMAMIMVWNLILWGILLGIIGILMLLFLIPMFLGLKK
jgi:hypothetical protein